MSYRYAIFFILFFLNSQTIFCQSFQTPLERSGYKKLSAHAEIIGFLQEAKKINPEIEIQSIGKTVSGRDIPMVKISFGSQNGNRLKIMIMGQTHGNEPSGKEGLLLLIKYFALQKNSEFLKNLEIYIIPQVNPDGGETNSRRNANKVDLNRNHLILTEPETQALHLLFDKIGPEITVDIHEYTPFGDTSSQFRYIKNTDIQFGTLTNINVDKDILRFSQEKVLPFVVDYIEKQHFSAKEYMVGSIVEDKKIRNSTVDINDGRQSFGILNTFSFIFEGLNGRDSLERIERRAKSQYQGAMSVIEFASRNGAQMLQMVNKGRERLISGHQNKVVFLQMEHFISSQPHKMHVLSLETNKDTLLLVKENYTNVKSLYETKRPIAYLIPESDTLLVNFLKRHQITYSPCKFGKSTKVFQYEFITIKKDSLEGLLVYNPDVKLGKVTEISESYLYVPLNQLKSSVLVLAFEPKSMLGLANYNEYAYLISGEKKYRILRVE